MDKLVWNFVSRNPNAIHLLEQNPTEIIWEDFFYHNTNPISMFWFEMYNVYLNFPIHPNTICLYLDQNPTKYTSMKGVNNYFLTCPDCFEYDYKNMSIHRTRFFMEDLMKKTWHPDYVKQWVEQDFDFW